MKRIYVFIALLFCFVSCRKMPQEYESPDGRIGALLSSYQQALVEAPEGWIGYLYPLGGGSYIFKFNFNDSNRVSMYSDFRESYATKPKESSYRLKADAVISLYFDTYSYIHELADPNPQVNQGVIGFGLRSDFEFSIYEFGVDTIHLRGNHNNSELILIRASQEQGDSYVKEVFDANIYLQQLDNFPQYFKQITIGGEAYGMTINTERKTFNLYYNEEGAFQHFLTEYVVTPNGIELREPFVRGESRLARLTNFILQPALNTATVQLDNAAAVPISSLESPQSIDRQAAIDFFVNNYTYNSATGFHIFGQTDFFDIRSIPNFVSLAYSPRYYIDNYDTLLLYFGGSLYGPVFRSLPGNDGIITFYNYIGMQGSAPGGNHTVKVLNTREVWLSPQGFYVVKTGNNAYDLVSVEDSRIWIRFR